MQNMGVANIWKVFRSLKWIRKPRKFTKENRAQKPSPEEIPTFKSRKDYKETKTEKGESEDYLKEEKVVNFISGFWKLEQNESKVTIQHNTREVAGDHDKSSVCGIEKLEANEEF